LSAGGRQAERQADLLIAGGQVVTASGVLAADVAVVGGRIAAVGRDLGWTAAEVIDATGLHVFPGGVDSHVHFDEPGHTDWETIADGSAALAAGGCTSFIDMPLNSLPVTTGTAAFDAKLEAALRSSAVDFGLWGGLVPGNLDELEALVERGVIGFKAFMCASGLDQFAACDPRTLREGMERIAALGSILLVHAEAPAIIEERARRVAGASARDFARSRPPEAELEAIAQAIDIADATGCRLHVVHVSTARGTELILDARRRGIDVSGETCPHYLLYSEDDLERLGGAGKCAPPLRSVADRDALRAMVADGRVTMVVSDHSPSPPELKQGGDYFKLWGGISGCQTTRQLLLALPLEPPVVAAVTATNVARRFGLERKGEVAAGFDADLWLADLGREAVVRREDLLYRHRFSAHEGQRIRGGTVHTILRGRTVRPGRPASRLIRPGAGS
jgi:allantoinase